MKICFLFIAVVFFQYLFAQDAGKAPLSVTISAKASRGPFEFYIRELDKDLEPNLETALAALALAAATFMMVVVSQKDDRISALRAGGETVDQKLMNGLKEGRASVRRFMNAFYFFTFLLIEGFSLDKLNNEGSPWRDVWILTLLDVIISSALMVAGLCMLVSGTLRIRRLVADETGR